MGIEGRRKCGPTADWWWCRGNPPWLPTENGHAAFRCRPPFRPFAQKALAVPLSSWKNTAVKCCDLIMSQSPGPSESGDTRADHAGRTHLETARTARNVRYPGRIVLVRAQTPPLYTTI